MKQLNFVLFDSQSSWGLEDIINSMYYSYSQLGLPMDFSMSRFPRENCINFIFEEFTKLNDIEISTLESSKNHLVLIVSEFVTRTGFNNFERVSRLKIDPELKANRKYLNLRRKSLEKVLEKVKFDQFLLLHGAIENTHFKNLVSKLNSETPVKVFHPILPVQESHGLPSNYTNYWGSLSLNLFDEKFYEQKNEDVSRIWIGGNLEHFLRYGYFEKRKTFDLDKSHLDFEEKLEFINSASVDKKVFDVQLSSSGAGNSYRRKWMKDLSAGPKDLLSSGFNFQVNIVSGWNKFEYSITKLIKQLGTPLFESKHVDAVVSISKNWPFLSPIRIWRSFACGLIPIRIGNIRDEVSPLKEIVEQVNSYYPVYTLFWATANVKFLEALLLKIQLYNEKAINENLNFFSFYD